MCQYEISVVTAVYSGGPNLLKSLSTILEQDVALEFIIVDDGSTDSTSKILQCLAADDSRVRVLSQSNQGLTASLILGCSEAHGEFIARHDCGDKSLPNRLNGQLSALKSDPGAAFHSCGTRFVIPEGMELYTKQQTTKELNRALLSPQLKGFYGPSHHGSVLFRRSVYEKCGGYRSEFYFAQDLDLWTRMIRSGPALAEPWVGYEAVVDAFSLSGEYRREQEQLRQIIHKLTRVAGQYSQKPLLRKAAFIRPNPRSKHTISHWRGNYFMASCLAAKNTELARVYLKKALAEHPTFIRAWVKYLTLFPLLRRNTITSL